MLYIQLDRGVHGLNEHSNFRSLLHHTEFNYPPHERRKKTTTTLFLFSTKVHLPKTSIVKHNEKKEEKFAKNFDHLHKRQLRISAFRCQYVRWCCELHAFSLLIVIKLLRENSRFSAISVHNFAILFSFFFNSFFFSFLAARLSFIIYYFISHTHTRPQRGILQ